MDQSDTIAHKPSSALSPAWAAALLLALAGLALLPWPLSPLRATPWAATALAAWAALELAFLLPLLSELTSDEGARVRAASREAQMGAGGRAALWLAAASGAYLPGGWEGGMAPARLLFALAATLALPAALGRGPFGPESALTGGPAQRSGLPLLAARLREAALLATVGLSWAPAGTVGQPLLALALPLIVAGGLALLLRAGEELLLRAPLPHALRICWMASLPLALAGLIYLALAGAT